MINKWILNNFKSINREKELNFRPLTIFTGANSSGKSTILQSILLVTQTLQDQIESRTIVLNGWFKKFGTYSDIVFHREDDRNIEIGFEIEEDEQEYKIDQYLSVMRIRHDGEKADCRFVLSSDGGKKDLLLPVLEELSIKTLGADGKKRSELHVLHEPIRDEAMREVIEQGKREYGEGYFDYSISLTNVQPQYSFRREQMGTPIGCNLSHFLPENVVHYTLYRDYMKEKLTYLLLYDHDWRYELEERDRQMLRPLLKEKAIEILEELRGKGRLEYFSQEKYDKRIAGLKKKFTLQGFDYVFRRSALSIEDKKEYINALLQKLYGLPDKYLFDREKLEFSHTGVSTVKSFFCQRIKYLGPLREEPKSFYQLDTSSTPMELGLKGENTAAVYENNKKSVICYIDPSFFENGAKGEPKIVRGKLMEAVYKWMTYLGVASKVTTNDRGMIGHSLKITNELGDMRQDLTHVGVGVSQVLPILVMSFLANKGDVIILEQPELHLHPKVQTRLADFFVSMTWLGKQCLIETHSEYLINRLRYRVAVSDNDRVARDTLIYFVEKDHEGYSKYREVTINEYGVIEDWPEGFFDESERLAVEILRAGMDKKNRQDGYQE